MIDIILRSYFSILISISAACSLVFLVGVMVIFRLTPKRAAKKKTIKKTVRATAESDDLSAIAGDDVIATQLDLARAYIETDNKHTAKIILETIIQTGNPDQQEEAKLLLGLM